MNSLTMNRDKRYIKRQARWISQLILAMVLILLLVGEVSRAWDVDFSRRRKQLQQKEVQVPMTSVAEQIQPLPEEAKPDLLDRLFPATLPSQEVVILQTEEGFMPKSVRLMRGQKYKISIVNVNAKEKNTSFVLDAFQQYHSTFYGKVKSFELVPTAEGVFTFQSPETSFEGRVVVVGAPTLRQPASGE